MSTSKNEFDGIQPYNWDGMEIGETRQYAHRFPQSVLTSFKNFGRARGQDWHCTMRCDPPTPKRGQRANVIWITRTAQAKPKPLGQITATAGMLAENGITGPFCLKAHGIEYKPVLTQHGNVIHPILIDIREIPVEVRNEYRAYKEGRVRLTRRGWDRMQLGDFQFTCQPFGHIRDQIRQSCAARSLLWVFEL